jgi:hypothetical protein
MNKQPKTKQTVVTTTTVARKSKQNRRQKGRANLSFHKGKAVKDRYKTNMMPKEVAGYISTLENPFQNGPVHLGWGTMCGTNLATAYSRGIITTHADGSFALLQVGIIGSATSGGVFYSNAGAGSFAYGALPYGNATQIGYMGAEARVVSMGIRVQPMLAATSVPGLLYCGSVPASSVATMISHTPTVYSTAASAHWGDGRKGAMVTGRPSSLEAYQFHAEIMTTVGSTDTRDYGFGGSYIVGLGFPASTKIAYECVCNVELIAGEQTVLTATESPGISSVFPNVESMWSKIKSVLPDQTTFSAMLDGLAFAASVGSHVHKAKSHMFPTGYRLKDEL